MPVYTVALGTPQGVALIPDGRGNERRVNVPPDPETLKAVADRTQALFFDAPSAGQLKQVYRDLGHEDRLPGRAQGRDPHPARVGIVLLMIAAGLNLAWSQRLP